MLGSVFAPHARTSGGVLLGLITLEDERPYAGTHIAGLLRRDIRAWDASYAGATLPHSSPTVGRAADRAPILEAQRLAPRL